MDSAFQRRLRTTRKYAPSSSKCKLGQGVRFKITAASDEPNLPAIPYQLDGDPGRRLPLK